MKHLLFVLLLLCSSIAMSQTIEEQINKMLLEAETANDSTRLAILNRVGFHYVFNDLPKSKKLLLQAMKEAKEKNQPYWQAATTSSYGVYHDMLGNSDSSRIYFERALVIANKHSLHAISSNVTNNLGMYHWNRSEFKDALDYFFKALKIVKENGEEKNETASLSNIGLIYQEMGQWDKALEYHKKALEIREEYKMTNEVPISLNNMAIIYKEKKEYKKALATINESITIARKQKMDRELFAALNTKGNIFLLTDKEEQAVPLFEEAIAKRNTLDMERKSNLANIESLLHYYNNQTNKKQSLALVKQGELLIEEFPELSTGANAFYSEAAKANFISGNTVTGNNYFEKAVAVKDSLFSKQNADAIASLETKFKVTEKEKELAESRANLAEKEIEINKKNTLVYGGFGLAIVLGLLGYLIYNQQRLKNRQLKKEGELKTALSRIETQNKLQEQRLRISRDLHDNIGSQLTFIISSIDNLKFGMKEKTGLVADKLSSISAFTTTTIFELRDTIWAMNKTEITLEDLQSRIANFIEKADVASDGTNFEFKISEDIKSDMVFTSVQGMNIYRIIQESVNNAVKYADASQITVLISNENDQMRIEINDDGKGFDVSEVTLCNGINNMRKRVKDLQGEITIDASPGKGTTIVVLI